MPIRAAVVGALSVTLLASPPGTRAVELTSTALEVGRSGSTGGISDPPPSPAELARKLRHANLSVRRRGAASLWKIEGQAREILPAVRMALADSDQQVRVAAALCLDTIDPKNPGIAPVLAEAMEVGRDDRLIRIAAALVKRRPDRTDAVVKRLCTLVEGDDPTVRRNALQALQEIGPKANAAVPTVINAYQTGNQELRRNAIWTLGSICDRQVVPILIAALNDAHHAARDDAVAALAQIRPMSASSGQAILDALQTFSEGSLATPGSIRVIADAVPDTTAQLIAMLSSEKEPVRMNAAAALGGLGGTAQPAIPALIKLLSESSSRARSVAAQALSDIARPMPPEAVAALLDAMNRADPNERVAEIRALASASTQPAARAAMVKSLLDKDEYVQSHAALTLGETALLDLLHDPRSAVRRAAIEGLGRFPPHLLRSELMPRVVAQLADREPETRRSAVKVLGWISTRPLPIDAPPDEKRSAIADRSKVRATTITAIANHLGDADPTVRAEAAAALGTIGHEARSAAGELGRVLFDPDPEVRERAVRSLGEIGTGAQDAAPALARLLGDKSQALRAAAALSLGQIGSPDASVRAALLKALATSDARTRGPAAWALARIGPSAEVASSLVRALKDPDPSVRDYAAMALAELRAPPEAHIVPALLQALRSDGTMAANALIEIGKRDSQVELQVAELLKDADQNIRFLAVFILAKIGSVRVSQDLIQAVIESDDRSMAQNAVEALADIGPDAAQSIATMVGHPIADKHHNRNELGQILRDIGPAVVPHLIQVLDDRTLLHDALALAAQGDYVALAQALESYQRRRRCAVMALGDFGGDEALTELMRAMTDSDPKIVQTALEAIRDFKGGSEATVAALQELRRRAAAGQARAAATQLLEEFRERRRSND